MSNRLRIITGRLVIDDDPKTYYTLIVYDNDIDWFDYRDKPYPKDHMKILKEALLGTVVTIEHLSDGKGASINGHWYDFEELKTTYENYLHPPT